MTKATLQEQVEEILAKAERKGLETDFFFKTTFKRYQVQMQILSELEKEIKSEGATVSKEYVKGRKNLYINPAVNAYNTTASAANSTVSTLMNIVNQFGKEMEEEPENESIDLIRSKIGPITLKTPG